MHSSSEMQPLNLITQRMRELRLILGYSIQQIAEITEISESTYRAYESGDIDLPFTFLHKYAKACGIEITDLLEGYSAKLTGYTVTRRGQGLITASDAVH